MNLRRNHLARAALRSLLFPLVLSLAASAQTERVLLSFSGGSTGTLPYQNGLISDTTGNLYGATYRGNNTFELLKPSGTNKNWTQSAIAALTGTFPTGKLVFDKSGNLYGATLLGGANSGGTAFKLALSGGVWTQTDIFDFDSGAFGATGSEPHGDLAIDGKGNLYGATFEGGANGAGVAFELSPPAGGVGAWTETILFNFSMTTGGNPYGSGVALSKGNLYGTTFYGGMNGGGVAYELSPPSGGVGFWNETVLHNFGAAFSNDGSYPQGGMILDAAGNLYGTTSSGGTHGRGTVFQLSQVGGTWTENVLYNFTGGTDGLYPVSGLLFDKSGNLYGTTYYGGVAGVNAGTVFKLAPGATWTFTTLYQFAGTPDGANASSALSIDPSGNLYGTTTHGGAGTCNCGTVFKLVP